MGRLSLVLTQQNFHRLRFFSAHRPGAFGVHQNGYIEQLFPTKVLQWFMCGVWLYDGANTGHVAAGWGFADAVTLGNTVAVRVVSHRGATAPTREALRLAHKNISIASAVAERLTGYAFIPSFFPGRKFLSRICVRGTTTTHENGEPGQYRDRLQGCLLFPARATAKFWPLAPYHPNCHDAGGVQPALPKACSRCHGCFWS